VYQGTVTTFQKCYRDKYVPGIGTITVPQGTQRVMRHAYVCEHCETSYAFPEQAEEDFYCHSAACKAVKLVSILPA
jgi:hypothetical protein